jgi:hypothetical protein
MLLVNKIKWVATCITLGGALATALAMDPLNIWLLNLGALLFLIWAYMIKDKAMMTVNFQVSLQFMFLVFSLGCKMTEDRQMIMQAVLEGKLPADSVTLDELDEVQEILFELICERQTPFSTFQVMQ